MNRIWQKWKAETSEIRLWKAWFSFWGVLSGFLACLLREANWGDVSCGKKLREALWPTPVRNWSSQSNSLRGPKSCESGEQAWKQFFPNQAFRWDPRPGLHLNCNFMKNLESEAHESHTWIPDSQNLWNNNCLLFQDLFGGISNTTIDT